MAEFNRRKKKVCAMCTGKTIVTDWCANELIIGGRHD